MNPEPTIPMQSEAAEPRAGSSAVPLWLVLVSFGMVFWALVYFDSNGGWFKPEVYAPYHNYIEVRDSQPRAEGFNRSLAEKRFNDTCGICHQPDGMGKPGQFPPLVGSEWVNGPANRLIRIPLLGVSGPIKVKGQAWNLSMPGLASTSDEDLALILTYIRSTWGNKADEIKTDHVKAVRAEVGGRLQQVTEPELMKLPEK
jgi:mono/diheme cytochrome c family protein